MPRRWVAIAGAALAAVGVCLTLVAGWKLTGPAPARVGAPPRDLGAESVGIDVPGGSTIRGWFAAGRPGGGAVLLLHPLRGNRTSMLSRARFLHADGRAVLLIDLQAHGESPGKRITFGGREAAGVQAAVAYLRSREPNERLAVLGWSLGGAAALLGPGSRSVDALILEAVYPTIEEAIADRLRIRLGGLGPRLAPALTAQLPLWTGLSADELRPIDMIAGVPAPILVIAGEVDPRTTLAESRELFAAAQQPKELWIVPKAGHDDFHATHPREYESRVRAFLERYLTPVQVRETLVAIPRPRG